MDGKGKRIDKLSVEEKTKIWNQINLSAFGKKMQAHCTLDAERSCDKYHYLALRRDGTEERKHPKRVLRIFIFYTVYRHGIKLDDEVGASALLHDALEDVSWRIAEDIAENYPPRVARYVDVLSRREGECTKRYFGKVFRSDETIMIKICDSIDNLADMIEKVKEGDESTSPIRLRKFLRKKVRPLIGRVNLKNLEQSKYKKAIEEALHDLKILDWKASEIVE